MVVGRPEDAVAFAAIRSGVADPSRAAGAFPTSGVKHVEYLLERATERDRRVLVAGLESPNDEQKRRGRGLGRGYG